MKESETHIETNAEKKERIRNRYKGIDPDELDVIPAIVQENFYEDKKEKRVAVYARVSTDDPRQTSSYELQKNHYQNLVTRHENWHLQEIYADEGISGTSLLHRDAFNRMIADCKAGKVDMIVTKSVSRFARNIVDSISTVRQLKELNPPIGVFFETENIYTLNPDSEMSLSFISTLAQEESHTKSEIMNSSIEMRFRMGIFLKPELLGYRVDEDGNLIINEEEAKIVRLIFFLYLYGYSTTQIAETLTKLKVPTKTGKDEWHPGTIIAVLKNERHCGDVLARKTFTPNYLNHKSKKNNKDRNQYRKRDDHEAIISRADFIAVQHMIANAKFKSRGVLPELEVICSGELSGFVIINFRWAGFNKEDYINACKSVPAYERINYFEVQEGDFDLRGFEVARTQFFNTNNTVSCTISKKDMYFSSAAISKLPPTEYVEVLINPVEKLMVVRPTKFEENRHAVKWAKKLGTKYKLQPICSAAFFPTMFEMFEWDENFRYKISGIRRQNGNNAILIFDLNETEIFIPTKKMSPQMQVAMNDLNKYGNSVKAYPPDWSDEFGDDYYNQKVKTQYDGSVADETAIYNTHPELDITPKEKIESNIHDLIVELREQITAKTQDEELEEDNDYAEYDE